MKKAIALILACCFLSGCFEEQIRKNDQYEYQKARHERSIAYENRKH